MGKLVPIEFKEQRIITTKVLAEEYGTEDIRITQNYLRNKERFMEGKHYYKLIGEELREFKANYLNDSNLKFTSELILWTDRGASRHAKILDTDEAWEVYEALEESYFNPKTKEKLLTEIKIELKDLVNDTVKEIVNSELSKIKEECSEFYKPPCSVKHSIIQYIKKRLGIEKANSEYYLVKQRALICLGVTKWEQIPVQLLTNSMNLIDECIEVIKKDRNFDQISLFDVNKKMPFSQASNKM